jgi:polyphosphate:AMP phosphotransferase
MFESAEIGHAINKATWRKIVPDLRVGLLDTQFELKEAAKVPVVILIHGHDFAGKDETIRVLYDWMDPHFLSTLAFAKPTEAERDRPVMWRYWQALPPKGRTGIFAGSWYSDPIEQRIKGHLALTDLDARVDQINRFEAMLVNEGALVLKFWFHLTKDGQKKRMKLLESDPHTAWRVTDGHRKRLKGYDRFQDVAGHVLRMTNTAWAPWLIVDGSDSRYRAITVGQVLLDSLRQRVANGDNQDTPVAPAICPSVDGRTVLTALNLKKKLDDTAYADQLAYWQGLLAELARDPRFAHRSLIGVFEGVDAAGKGGAIRHIAAALDARQFQIVPVASPTEEERAQPYLWRFWRHVPRCGRITLFDRSWYGRVLVERVEGFCSERDWLRAYSELNDFEHELSNAGAIVVKFWLQISQAEQLKRFKVREKTPFKRFKITEEDWRNRDKWAQYQQAAADMVDRTSTGTAPWTLVESNDKNYARVKILQTICERLLAELNGSPAGQAALGDDGLHPDRNAEPGAAERKLAERKVAKRIHGNSTLKKGKK